MFRIERDNVSIGQNANSKFDAINIAAQLLVQSGKIKPEYIQSMGKREEVSNTYIGSGIAIPHGMQEDRELIFETAISVAQFPEGVDWNGEKAFTVIGIAAKSDEHIAVIRRLTHLLDDQPALEALRTTGSKEDITEILTGIKEDVPMPPPADFESYRESSEVPVPGSVGLHARPALVLVDKAKIYKGDLLIQFNDRFADGKSLASILKLGAEAGRSIILHARGSQAKEMIRDLTELINSGMGEPEEQEENNRISVHWRAGEAERIVEGISGSGGIAIGKARNLRNRQFNFEEKADDALKEIKKLREAVEIAAGQLDSLFEKLSSEGGTHAAIFLAHKEFLNDPAVIKNAEKSISSGKSAAWSWNRSIEENMKNLKGSGSSVMMERAADMRDIGNRVLAILTESDTDETISPDEAVIYLAGDLSPSETANLDRNKVLAFCTREGGSTSHTAITARSLNIPAVVGCAGALEGIADGTQLIVDGSNGLIYINPSEKDIKEAGELQKEIAEKKNEQYSRRMDPALTTDGERISILANIGSLEDSQKVLETGGEGVGLLRSEFLFLDRDSAPDEEEQFRTYAGIIENLKGAPLTIRTLDIGGDKKVDYLKLDPLYNSFLGVRGIRLSFEREELFRIQIRAIYRSSEKGPVQIMFPMIAEIGELKRAKAICEEERIKVGAEPVPLGIMIEVPSAALMADELAAEADFFSIGTNDLTQYTLAMDRLHPTLAKQAEGYHPAILKLIKQSVLAAHMAGIPCSVCGGIASKSFGALLLMGMGVNKLSVDIPSIPKIKSIIRSHSFMDSYTMAGASLKSKNTDEVKSLDIRKKK